MSYRINKKIRNIKNELIKLTLLERSAYSKAFSSVDSKKNVSQMKAEASAEPGYLKASIALQKAENERDYWKGTYDVMNNAHIFFRNLLRD